MGSFENLESDKSSEKEELLDQAVIEARERIRENLKETQKMSEDESFKLIEIDSLDPGSLMVLNELAKTNDIFPMTILRKAVEGLMESDPLFNEKRLTHEASIEREYLEQPAFDTPEEKQAYEDEFIQLHADAAKAEIAGNPNKYYTEDLLNNDYGKAKNQYQGTVQPNTRA